MRSVEFATMYLLFISFLYFGIGTACTRNTRSTRLDCCSCKWAGHWVGRLKQCCLHGEMQCQVISRWLARLS